MTREQAETYCASLKEAGLDNLHIQRQRAALGLPPDPSLPLDNTLPVARVQQAPVNVTDLRGVEAQAERFKPRTPRPRAKKEKQEKPAVDPVTRWDLLELGDAA